MDYRIHKHQSISSLEAAKDLTYPPLEAMTHNRLADLAAGRDSEPDNPRLIGVKVDRHQGSVSFPTEPVTTHVVSALTQPLVAAQPFTNA